MKNLRPYQLEEQPSFWKVVVMLIDGESGSKLLFVQFHVHRSFSVQIFVSWRGPGGSRGGPGGSQRRSLAPKRGASEPTEFYKVVKER